MGLGGLKWWRISRVVVLLCYGFPRGLDHVLVQEGLGELGRLWSVNGGDLLSGELG